MKTLTKQEAVRAFLDGKRVEYRKFEEWYAVKSYSVFDHDLSFRLADTDEDAEWLRVIVGDVYGGRHRHDARLRAIADRIERDAARIAELEAEVQRMKPLNPHGVTTALSSIRLAVIDEDVEWLLGEADLCVSDGIPQNADRLRAIANRIAELEAEVKRLKPSNPHGLTDSINPDEDLWLRHDGGPMPCDGKMYVEYKMRDRQIFQAQAKSLYWEHLNTDSDIIAWRPAKGGDK